MADRKGPPKLEELYRQALNADPRDPNAPSDICEHLPLLRHLASRCEHVTEFGMRRANGSTVALLAGQPEKLISWDIDPRSVVSENVAALFNTETPVPSWDMKIGRTKFEPRVGDTLKIDIEPTDMLFIDTLHTFDQLKAELWRHCDQSGCKVKKWIVFHDVETFGRFGEDGKEPGVILAIRYFQKNNFPLWGLKYHWRNNNGLAVLERIDVDSMPGVNPDPGWPQFK